MNLFDTLTEENFLLYGAKNYYNPNCIDAEEFYDDLKRFNYIRRLIHKYINFGVLSERLMLNHFIIIFNVFGIQPGLKMLEFRIGIENWSVVKPFLIFLKVIRNTDYIGIKQEQEVVSILRKI